MSRYNSAHRAFFTHLSEALTGVTKAKDQKPILRQVARQYTLSPRLRHFINAGLLAKSARAFHRTPAYKQQVLRWCALLGNAKPCLVCGCTTKPATLISPNSRQFCSKACLRSPEGQALVCITRKLSFTEKYGEGVTNGMQLHSAKAKHAATLLKHYGVTNGSHSLLILGRIKATTFLRYGVEHPFQSACIYEAYKQTMLASYGVTNNSHRPEILQRIIRNSSRSRFTQHEVTLSGRTFTVQGTYEAELVRRMVARFGAKAVVTQFSPRFPLDEARKLCGYTPDFYIKRKDIFIECKSDWTLLLGHQRNQLARNQAKARFAGDRLRWVVGVGRKSQFRFVSLPTDWYTWTRKRLVLFLGSKF